MEFSKKDEERFNFGLETWHSGNPQNAIEIFKELLKRYGETVSICGALASIYYEGLKDLKNALIYFKKSVELNPKSEIVSLGLFHCLFELGRKEEAEQEIKRYISSGGKIENYKILFDENDLTIEDFA